MLGVSVTPTIGLSNNEDNTPPVTTISLDPPEPDGLNGWYVSDVNVTLNATDDISGVNATYYRIDGGKWEIYIVPFTLSEDGDDILIEYYSVDNAGNEEDIKSAYLDIDQICPNILISLECIGGNIAEGYDILIGATAIDAMSGMDRVEFYINDELIGTIYGPGPSYEYIYNHLLSRKALGLIRKAEVTEELVRFYAIIVIMVSTDHSMKLPVVYGFDNAGNSCYDSSSLLPTDVYGILLLKHLTIPNNYTGYIGRFLIFAEFHTS